jgi:hypothetical protein
LKRTKFFIQYIVVYLPAGWERKDFKEVFGNTHCIRPE